jgi:mono/diheme cytochrome c family protein
LLVTSLLATPALADPASVARGLRLAQANCSACHAIGAEGDSPDPYAPRFRDLAERDPGRSMEEIFARALLRGHPDMPRFGMREPERADILAYVETIKQAGAEEAPR